MARSCYGVCLVPVALAAAAGCSGSAKIVVENRLDRPVEVVAAPSGGKFIAAKRLGATIAPGEAVQGWLLVHGGFLPEVARVGVQVKTDASGPFWIGHLVDQARYEFRVLPGSDGPAVEQRLSSWGLSGWRPVELKPLTQPWLVDSPERRVRSEPSKPIQD